MKFKQTLTISMCGGFLLLDQFLKWQALHSWSNDYLIHRWFGWHPFFNPGVAFGIPLPNGLIIGLTIPVVLLLVYILVSTGKFVTHNSQLVTHGDTSSKFQVPSYESRVTSYTLILAGAISNLIDRVRFGHTIDYLLIFTAVINVADILIVIGFILYFRQLTKPPEPSTTV